MGVDAETLVGCCSLGLVKNIQYDARRLRQREMAVLVDRLDKFHLQDGLAALFARDEFFDAEVWRRRAGRLGRGGLRAGAACAAGGFDELSLPIEQPEKASMPATAIFNAGEDSAAIASVSRKLRQSINFPRPWIYSLLG